MPERGEGTIINVIAMFQTLSAELEGTGVNIQVVCPDAVATEFHEGQGMDLSRVRRMTADDVVTASLPSAPNSPAAAAPPERGACRQALAPS
jgi:short-subunit dehydrogenase